MNEQDETYKHPYLDLVGTRNHTESDLDPEIVRQEAKAMEDLAETTFAPENIRGRISSVAVEIPLYDHQTQDGELKKRVWKVRLVYVKGRRHHLEMFVGGHSPFYRVSSESKPPEIYWTETIVNEFRELESYSRKNDPLRIKYAREKLDELVEVATHPQNPTGLIA